jgi:hypothetical protein
MHDTNDLTTYMYMYMIQKQQLLIGDTTIIILYAL